MSEIKRRIGAVGASIALAVGGAGVATGCGDDDNEGAAEEAGQAVDDASQDVQDAADDAGQELQEAGEDVDDSVGDDDGKGDDK